MKKPSKIIIICSFPILLFCGVMFDNLILVDRLHITTHLMGELIGGRIALPNFICAFLVFTLFGNIKIGYIPLINKFASSILSVFLIHANKYVAAWMWPHFNWRFEQGALLMILSTIIISIGVLLCCNFIGQIYHKIELEICRRIPVCIKAAYQTFDSFIVRLSE